MKPFVSDIESFRLLMVSGEIRECSRSENQELFSLVFGGYGLFGIVLSAKLKLMRRQILRRRVKVIDSPVIIENFDSAVFEGGIYGDFQYSCDEKSDQFLKRGVFSYYTPESSVDEIPETQDFLNSERWKDLVYLAHVDKARAFSVYAEHYLRTSGQLYHSDAMQLSTYLDGYHNDLDKQLGASCKGSEMITEIYVPKHRLGIFLREAAEFLKRSKAHLIYGTVRLIKKDTETFLAWAKYDFACVIFNLHVDHNQASMEAVAGQFRGLIDLGLANYGSYYLTYHRFARKDQVLATYPQMKKFLALKLKYDPKEVFQSDWYRHYREMFCGELDGQAAKCA